MIVGDTLRSDSLQGLVIIVVPDADILVHDDLCYSHTELHDETLVICKVVLKYSNLQA